MEKSNQKRLEEYLVGNVEKKEIGYLKSEISNAKVIMLSGKWGSGKTFFWKNKIQTVLNGNDKKIPNNYISLYGKTSIQEIKNEIFLKIFESVDSSELEEKGMNLAKNTVDLISLFTKSVGIDLSKLTDKPFEDLEKILENKKLKKTEEYLNSGAIICFDDFERKSKDIDLNDLFGFITQLTLNFSCKVVIILNDDVFEGEEKKIFSNVKEKSVSKFLKYEPSIKELFETIFENDERYRKLDDYKELILKTIEETKELNARIYIQVLDNLVEWIEKVNKTNENYIKFFIYVNVNFILNHLVLFAYFNSNKKGFDILGVKSFANFINDEKISFFLNSKIENIPQQIGNIINKITDIQNLINNINIKNDKETTTNSTQIIDNRQQLNDFINKNTNLLETVIFFKKIELEKLIESNNKAESEVFNRISNFIETGILINE